MKRLIPILLIFCALLGCGRETLEPEQGRETGEPSVTAAQPEPTQLPTEQTMPQEPENPPEEPDDSALVRVLDYIPGIRQDLAYASEKNFTGQRIYDFKDAYLRYGTVKKLIPVCEELEEQGLGLLIWDGFRPLSAQWTLWNMYPDPAFVSHPQTGSRSHCRGSALDVTLVDLDTGEMLEMPTGFDDFSALADRDYSDCSGEAAANAQYLEQVMKNYGFVPYVGEWWHFADSQDYPVEAQFQPPQEIFAGGVG